MKTSLKNLFKKTNKNGAMAVQWQDNWLYS